MTLLKYKKNSHSIIVTFGNDTTVKLSARIKTALLKILDQPVGHYRFDLSDIVDTDITFIQLLIAFNLSVRRREGRVSIINCPENSPVMQVCSLCGINLRSILEFE